MLQTEIYKLPAICCYHPTTFEAIKFEAKKEDYNVLYNKL